MATWTDRAACRGMDTELFFPAGTGAALEPQIAEAKALCVTCPVRLDCLADAQVRPEQYGIWGGMEETERLRECRNARRRVGARREEVA